MVKYIFTFLCIIFSYIFLDEVIFFVELVQLIIFFILITISIKYKNNFLTIILGLSAISNLIGGLFFYNNRYDFDYSGWNAVMNFDFSPAFYFSVYSKYLLNLSLFTFFVLFFDKIFKYNKFLYQKVSEKKIDISNQSHIYNSTSKIKFTILLIFLLFFSVFLSIEMYTSKIAIIGIQNKPLPFKLNGILFYLRAYIFPILLFLFYKNSFKGIFTNILVLFCGLLIGMLSISKGITYMYIFPTILTLILSRRRINVLAAFIILILAYVNTSFAREITFENLELTTSEFFSLYFDSFYFDNDFFLTAFKVIGALANRLYGPQDLVLADQYILTNTFENFLNFLSFKSLVPDLAKEIYGLDFGPDSGFGVGMGLGGVLIILLKSSLFTYTLAILFFSFLVSVINSASNILFKININTRNLNPFYLFLLLFLAFNVVEGSVKFLYVYLIFVFVFFIVKKGLRKINIFK